MRKRILSTRLCIVLVVSVLGMLLAHATLAPTSSPMPQKVEMPKLLTIMGGTTPGSVPDMGAKWMAKIIPSIYPETTCRSMPGGTQDAVHKVDTGEVSIGFTTGQAITNAWNAVAPLYTYKHRNIRQLHNATVPGGGTVAVVLAGSPIKDFLDLKNKRLGVGMKTSTNWEIHNLAFKKVYGFDFASIATAGGLVHYGQWSDQLEMMAEGKLDCVLMTAGPADTGIKQLNVRRGVRLLYFTDAYNKAIIDGIAGYAEIVYPAGVLEYLPKEYKCLTPLNTAVISATMPDGVVYNILEALFRDKGAAYTELRPIITQLVPSWKYYDHACDDINLPLHPGAENYYKERGFKLKEPRVKLSD